MFSPAKVSSMSAPDIAPSALSLEFAWKAKSTYWAGEIRVIDLYIDNQRRYTISIPQRDDRATQAVSLPFKKYNAIYPGLTAPEVNYLIIKNLDTTRKITLKAGIFNQKQGNTLTRNLDGSWSRDIRYTREDISIDLDVSSLQLGKHYKIIASHTSERTAPGSSFWQGDSLQTTLEENGLCRKTATLPPQTTTFASASSSAASRGHESLLPSQLELKLRKESSEHPDEIEFFTLSIAEKYEEAIVYASNMENQALGGRMILDLLKHRDELGINVNTMNNNPLKQTPLHRVAINKKWHAYYALVERGAKSYLHDSNGVPASEYRSRNGMTIFDTQAQQQIRQDLFGDAAPAAEAFINTVNGANAGECRIS